MWKTKLHIYENSMKIEAKKGRKSIELKIDLKSSGYDMDYFKNSIECIMRYAYVDSFFSNYLIWNAICLWLWFTFVASNGHTNKVTVTLAHIHMKYDREKFKLSMGLNWAKTIVMHAINTSDRISQRKCIQMNVTRFSIFSAFHIYFDENLKWQGICRD